MLRPLLLSSAILLLAFLPAPTPQSQKPKKPAAAAPEPAIIAVEPPRPDVKQVYKTDCAICHGDTGTGKTDLATSMNLTLIDWTNPTGLASKSDQQLFDMIRKGNDKMPPEDPSRATDDQVKGLIKFIRGFASQAPAATPAPAAPSATPSGSSSPSPNSN